MYILAYSPYIATFLLFIFLFEVFVWKPKREYRFYCEFVDNIYQKLKETQGEEVANEYLEFRTLRR